MIGYIAPLPVLQIMNRQSPAQDVVDVEAIQTTEYIPWLSAHIVKNAELEGRIPPEQR